MPWGRWLPAGPRPVPTPTRCTLHDQALRCRDLPCPADGISSRCPDRLPDRPRGDSRRRALRLQSRVSGSHRSRKIESHREWRGPCRCLRPARNVRGARRRQGSVGADASRRHPDQAGQRHSGSQRWRAQPHRRVDGLRYRAAQGEERHPVHRRRALAGASRGCPSALQGHCRGQEPRQACDRRHAAHGAGGDRRLGFDHHRFGERRERLRHRPQDRGQCHGCLCRPHRKPVR